MTKDNEKVIKELSVIGSFDNGNAAWRAYKKIHDEDQSRELYIFHTENEDIKVIERPYIGVRRKI